VAVLPGATMTFAAQGTASGTAAEFSASDLQILAAAMDEIIPAGDGMPSATVVGGPQYLQSLAWQYPRIQQEISEFLKTLAQVSAAQFGMDFPQLKHEQRLQILATVERNQAPTFSSFVSYVYEAYYTRPQVIGLLGCGPPLPLADDIQTLLAPVRKLSHLYREVP